MIEIKKSELTNPTESGWYLCKYKHNSVTYYKGDDAGLPKRDIISHDICECNPMLLYWEQNVWLPSPRSFRIIEERNVLSWQKVQEDYNVYEEKIKLIY